MFQLHINHLQYSWLWVTQTEIKLCGLKLLNLIANSKKKKKELEILAIDKHKKTSPNSPMQYMITRKVRLHPMASEINFSIVTSSLLPSPFCHLSVCTARVPWKGTKMCLDSPWKINSLTAPFSPYLPIQNPERAPGNSQQLELCEEVLPVSPSPQL